MVNEVCSDDSLERRIILGSTNSIALVFPPIPQAVRLTCSQIRIQCMDPSDHIQHYLCATVLGRKLGDGWADRVRCLHLVARHLPREAGLEAPKQRRCLNLGLTT